MRLALAIALVVGLVGCGDNALNVVPTPGSAAPPAARSKADETSLLKAAEDVWKAIDDYDAKSFAALSIERKGDGRSPAEITKGFEGTVTDLHQKYGARRRVLSVEPKGAGADDTGMVDAVIGDAEEAIALTFTRVGGVWKLSLISTADPAAPH